MNTSLVGQTVARYYIIEQDGSVKELQNCLQPPPNHETCTHASF